MTTSAHKTPSRRFKLVTRGARRRLAVLFLLIFAFLLYSYFSMIRMPGRSFSGPLPALTPAQLTLSEELRSSVRAISDDQEHLGRVGNRSTFYPRRFAAAAAWLHDELTAAGYSQIEETFTARGAPAPNLAVSVPGATLPGQVIVIGAHYDAYQGSPGADDNASGTAACLALARLFRHQPQARTLRFAFFVNEEPPAFQTPDQGSWVYARKCRAANDDIRVMLSLESIGYYTDTAGSQQYPRPLNWLYPDTGNFIGFVTNWSNRDLNRRLIALWRDKVPFPSQGALLPGFFPGVDWSDHWSFWQEGYPALMITDTATFRNPHYHTPGDTPDTLDFDRMARVVEGIQILITSLAAPDAPTSP